jgi:hypothetical protein
MSSLVCDSGVVANLSETIRAMSLLTESTNKVIVKRVNDQRVGVTIIVGLFWKVGIGMDVFVSVETILMIVLQATRRLSQYSWCTVNFLGLTDFILRRFPLQRYVEWI